MTRTSRGVGMLVDQARSRRARLGAALVKERAAGRVRDDLDCDQLQNRAELVINGFEVTLAGGADPATCVATMRSLLADGLGWRA